MQHQSLGNSFRAVEREWPEYPEWNCRDIHITRRWRKPNRPACRSIPSYTPVELMRVNRAARHHCPTRFSTVGPWTESFAPSLCGSVMLSVITVETVSPLLSKVVTTCLWYETAVHPAKNKEVAARAIRLTTILFIMFVDCSCIPEHWVSSTTDQGSDGSSVALCGFRSPHRLQRKQRGMRNR